MADAIAQLASDPASRAAFASNAITSYNADFTIEQMDAAYMRLYQPR
jgi:glycosyltransferase involved in cell wall biosynthesis